MHYILLRHSCYNNTFVCICSLASNDVYRQNLFSFGSKIVCQCEKERKSVKIHLGEYDVQCDGKMEPKRSVEMNLRQFEQLLRVKESVRDHCLNLTRALPSGDEAGQELTQQPHCSLRGDDSFPSVPAFYTPVVHSEL